MNNTQSLKELNNVKNVSKSTVNFQDSAPSPWPIYNVVLETLPTIMFLTNDLRTLACPRTKEAQFQQKPSLHTAIQYSLHNY